MKNQMKMKQVVFAMIALLAMTSCKKNNSGTDPEPEPKPVDVTAITITELRALSTGASIEVPDGRSVKGIVISDASQKNIDTKTLILQEATDKPAIVVNFAADVNFALNDEVEVIISKQKLEQMNGEIMLNDLPVANAKKIGTGTIMPRQTTIAEIKSNKANWNGTLVTIGATTMRASNGTIRYEGALFIREGDDVLSSYILPTATFRGKSFSSVLTSITGIVRIRGNEETFLIRREEDVVGNTTLIDAEDFSNITTNPDNYLSFSASNGEDWNLTELTGIYDGGLHDGGFLSSGRDYVYLLSAEPNYELYNTASGSIMSLASRPDLKSITVTFAGSTIANKEIEAINGFKQTIAPLEADGYIQIGLMPASNGTLITGSNFSYIITKSSEYKEIGKWYTVTFTIPTKQELVDMGVDPGVADDFVDQHSFLLTNTSSSPRGDNNLSPIIIDKVEFGY